MTKSHRLLAGLIVALPLLSAAGAQAVTLSVIHVFLPQRMSQDACLDRGRQMLRDARLSILNRTDFAVTGEVRGTQQLYTIYCVAERDLVVISGADTSPDQVDGMVNDLANRLRDSFQRGIAPRARK